jgi:hypothetical protein
MLDGLLVGGVLALLLAGIWALWWDDVRGLWRGPEQPALIHPAPQT